MTNRLKDAEDRLLEAMLRSEPMADHGFSRRVMRRIRRRLWLPPLILTTAILVGGGIALRPGLELAAAASKLLADLPPGLPQLLTPWFPPLQVMVLGAVSLIVMMLGLVED